MSMISATAFLESPRAAGAVSQVSKPSVVDAVPDGLRLAPELADVLLHDQRIVDLGCGSGKTCLDLVQSGFFAVTGVDRDAAAVERARQAADRLQARPLPRFVVADVTRLALPGGSFAAAIMQGLLTTLTASEDRARAMAEAQRILAPRGRLYLAEVAQMWHDPRYRECYMEGRQETGETGTLAARHPHTGELLGYAHHYTEQELVALLLDAGFEIEEFCYDTSASLRTGQRISSMTVVGVNAK
jgi:ubiquinone/menaquinone biosynthesis C-methylase UbiE